MNSKIDILIKILNKHDQNPSNIAKLPKETLLNLIYTIEQVEKRSIFSITSELIKKTPFEHLTQAEKEIIQIHIQSLIHSLTPKTYLKKIEYPHSTFYFYHSHIDVYPNFNGIYDKGTLDDFARKVTEIGYKIAKIEYNKSSLKKNLPNKTISPENMANFIKNELLNFENTKIKLKLLQKMAE